MQSMWRRGAAGRTTLTARASHIIKARGTLRFWLIKRHEGGYYPFREDITDVIHFGGRNVISVRVDATKFEGWFYEGAGIYRHVWLDKTAPVAIAPDGVFVYSKFKDNVPDGPAEIHAEIKIINANNSAIKTKLTYAFKEPNGQTVGELNDTIKLEANSQKEISTNNSGLLFTLDKYEVWTPENPKLYKLVTTVEVDGKVVDQKETLFGIRTVGFDKDKGFLLNGQPYELKGTCNHQDHAGVGAAIPDALQEFRVKQLKAFG